MKVAFTTLLFCCVTQLVSAQFDSLGLNTHWNEGALLLRDTRLLKGSVQYNDKLGLIKFNNHIDNNEQSFTFRNVLALKFYDKEAGTHRKFLSVRIKHEKTEWQGEMFFEILLETKAFAVLSKRDGVMPAVRYANNGLQSSYVHVGYEQFERICLVKADGSAEILLVCSNFESHRKGPFSSRVMPYLNKEALKECTGAAWPLMLSYIRDHDLKLKEREDLLQALQYFKSIESSYADRR